MATPPPRPVTSAVACAVLERKVEVTSSSSRRRGSNIKWTRLEALGWSECEATVAEALSPTKKGGSWWGSEPMSDSHISYRAISLAAPNRHTQRLSVPLCLAKRSPDPLWFYPRV
eukprot:scaffold127841_cov28-Tisochrysis_lutea.AAC.7